MDKRTHLPEDVRLMISCLQAYSLGFAIDSDAIVDPLTQKMLHKNHLRCMLRRDYTEAGGTLTGKPLTLLIDGIIRTMPQACARAAKDFPEYVQPSTHSPGEYL